MKKSLVALAALAVVGTASAQSTVTLYGKIDAALQSKSTTGVTDQGLQINSGGLNTSRWGLKGSEDLGGGLKVNFQLESGFNVDTGAVKGASTLFSRVAVVDLTGDFGTVSAGLQWTPYDNGFLDAQDYSSASAMSAAYYAGAHGDNGNTGWGNAKNSIQYATPDMRGFSATVMYAPGEDKTAALSASRYTGFGLYYVTGPLEASLAQETSTEQGTGSTINAWILAASYNLKVAKLFASIERASNETSSGGDDAGWSLGVSMPIGSATSLAASYARESTTNATGTTVNSDTNSFGTQLVHNLSKRTNVYAAYVRSETTPTVGTNTTSRTFSLGMRHSF